MTASTEAVRNAGLPTLMEILNDRQARKIDIVAPASKIRFEQGDLVLSGLDQIVGEDGVTDPNGKYQPTSTFDDHLAERLDIAPAYLRRLRHGKAHKTSGKLTAEPRLDLFDANTNGLLGGRKAKVRVATTTEVISGDCEYDEATDRHFKVLTSAVDPDSRSFLVRLFRSDETGRGIARGLLSNRYLRMEDLDGLLAMLAGIQESGVDPSTLEVYGDLTETRMYVHVRAPQIAVWAPELLDGYRSPFDTGIEGTKRQAHGRSMQERIALGQKLIEERGWARGYEGQHLQGNGTHAGYAAGTAPIIHAGFKMMNSELGNGRWMIVPEFTVLACDNGLTSTTEAFARTHVGSKLEDGHMEWSADTQAKELALVTAQTKDVVAMALNQDYLEKRVGELSEKAGKQVTEDQAQRVLEQRSRFTKDETAGILRHFLMGGQSTAGGLMNAVTSYSQTLDADSQYEMDNKALGVLEHAVAVR